MIVVSVWWIFHDIENRERKKERKFLIHMFPHAPVNHNPYLTIPEQYLTQSISNDILSFASSKESDSNFKDDVSCSSKAPYVLKQTELDDLARDIVWNLLHLTCEDTKSKERLVMFANFSFVSERRLRCYCADVTGLFHEIEINYIAPNWRLFIDSLKQRLTLERPELR